ncbi:hypothetical protein SELMODRAFT_423880 [Selaginella moellendorffii]|uniref:Uncharacterized protein n=1 Tax=Selaginella moellendorffii TaxID=88036 RepID=D8SN37_SELML|nr:hypothetical protein SELMODRAFT_423880 [Selaginella moellendorffii]
MNRSIESCIDGVKRHSTLRGSQRQALITRYEAKSKRNSVKDNKCSSGNRQEIKRLLRRRRLCLEMITTIKMSKPQRKKTAISRLSRPIICVCNDLYASTPSCLSHNSRLNFTCKSEGYTHALYSSTSVLSLIQSNCYLSSNDWRQSTSLQSCATRYREHTLWRQ